MKDSLWFRVHRWCNAHAIGWQFKRQSLMKKFKATSRSSLENQIDIYRRYLTKAGYVDVIEPGIYKLVKVIPKHLTIECVREEAYSLKQNVRTI